METWPSTNLLPRPAISFAGDLEASALRVKMESNTTRQRRQFSVPSYKFAVEWSFTQLEFDLFSAFLKFKLHEGTDQFLFPINIGNGFELMELRFVSGDFRQTFDSEGFWRVSAKLETAYTIGTCTPNIYKFLTVPMGYVDLSAFFVDPVASYGAAEHWRLITDDCGYDIPFFEGDINLDGTLNRGVSAPEPDSGWNSDLLSFYSSFGHPEGIYLQVSCGGIWNERPCIVGGDE